MKPLLLSLITSLFALLLIAAAPDDKPKGGASQGGQVEPAVVPPYLFNVWLCRPGAESVTVSVLAWDEMEAFIEYGDGLKPAAVKLKAGEPQNIVLGGLKPDMSYNYRLNYSRAGGEAVQDAMRSFHTQRKAGSTFSIVMQADSHLDNNTDVRVYQQSLANMLTDKPDSMIDLGDTTMVDKFGKFFRRSESQYKAQRYYMGRMAHSVPIFMVLGNHDGERGSDPEMSKWSLGMRHTYFPNPTDGNDKHSYFAFEWGNVLFIGLDPFWSTIQRGASGWDMTLGEKQYHWLTTTLTSSKAAMRFVFIHHLVGGLGRDVRGAAKPAAYMEWGGKNANGSEGFQEHRPGWEMPLHQLFVKHGVNIVLMRSRRPSRAPFGQPAAVCLTPFGSTVTTICSSKKSSMASSTKKCRSPVIRVVAPAAPRNTATAASSSAAAATCESPWRRIRPRWTTCAASCPA